MNDGEIYLIIEEFANVKMKTKLLNRAKLFKDIFHLMFYRVLTNLIVA